MKTRMILERPKDRYSKPYDKYDYAAMTLLCLILAVIMLCGATCEEAHASPDYSLLADSIRVAEGNPNYGVLTSYKHTTPRRACINTCKHAWIDYAKTTRNPSKSGYIAFLGARYCPTRGFTLRPSERALNKNWVPNINRLYKGSI